MVPKMKALGSIAARPGICSKATPAKVWSNRRYQSLARPTILKKDPADTMGAGSKDCGFWAAGAQVLANSRSAQRRPMTLCYKVFQNSKREALNG